MECGQLKIQRFCRHVIGAQLNLCRAAVMVQISDQLNGGPDSQIPAAGFPIHHHQRMRIADAGVGFDGIDPDWDHPVDRERGEGEPKAMPLIQR